MAVRTGSSRQSPNIWPGFVDALATLLMVLVFLLMIFVVAQFFLNDAISGRDSALLRLQNQVSELGELLALERRSSKEMRLNIAQLSEELQSSVARRDELRTAIETLTIRSENAENRSASLQLDLADAQSIIKADKETIDIQLASLAKLRTDVDALQALKSELEQKIVAAAGQLEKSEGILIEEKKISESARAQVALLNRQMASLREQLGNLQALLDASEQEARKQNVQISNLGQRLNSALAGKVQELSRYRSEFFGRLREVLGNRPGIRIVGDRFVFQSEVLFDTGSADLGPTGKAQIASLAETLQNLARTIPSELKWILEIGGHTDKVPIRTAQYPSNWELSTARAVAVVKFLTNQGIPPNRLAATGFGEFQPIEPGESPIAYRRNRRIEFKLTQH
jgi:chemotaxis protein MotB